MTAPSDFDVFASPLDGLSLIEASAGTGKTWTICGIYLRLLLERRLSVEQILVVTFTNAATAELRERIRARIADTLACLRGNAEGTGPGSGFVGQLVAAVRTRTASDDGDLASALEVALQSFDAAAVHTIHGFCQRALADSAFAAGLPFAPELAAGDEALIAEAVNDFWRGRIAAPACPAALARHLAAKGDTPQKYARLVARSLAKPLARTLWPDGVDTAAPPDTARLAAPYAAARATWAACRAEIVALLRGSAAALNASRYGARRIDEAVAAWDAWLDGGDPAASFDDARARLLSTRTLEAAAKKGAKAPEHAFFAQADALLAARSAVDDDLELARLALLRELGATVVPALRRLKRDRRLVAFDDMLYNLYAALESAQRPGLANALRTKFPVALIDEFQDTDPLQFAIFERIYGAGAAPVFLVGDPKQAIYSFRNADLHAYLRARARASATYTLAQNQRSSQGLIEAVNGLFSANARAFLLPGLGYRRVAMGEHPRKPFGDATLTRADLQLWALPEPADAAPIAKAQARAQSARACAREIARLVAEGRRGRIELGGRGLSPGDIAVLVRTHAQGSEMKRELGALGIGSVELAQESVFHSPDAEEVERVLAAINEPSREALLRAALATEMMGGDAASLAALADDEAALAARAERFAAYREVWLRQGAGVMVRRLLTGEGVSARMLRRDDGERRLTNLLHLGELIHAASATRGSPDALLRWLRGRRHDAAADDAAQLRLESDRNLVQIVTIYKSKGLEFPIVFCPFLWDGRAQPGPPGAEGREYHDADGTAVIDFRGDDALGADADRVKAQVRLEEAAETVRLVYVALTRAIHRCYVVTGCYASRAGTGASLAESTKSVLNWIACGGGMTWESWLGKQASRSDIAAGWASLVRGLAPHADLAPLPVDAIVPAGAAQPVPAALAARPAPAAIAPAWRIASFSGIVGGLRGEATAHDRDAHVADGAHRPFASPADLADDDILRFPRGPRAGECLHAIFERIDFTDASGWSAAVDRALAAHHGLGAGMPAAAPPALLRRMALSMLDEVVHAKLPGGVTLAAIPRTRCLAELEFSLPAAPIDAHGLDATLAGLGYAIPRLAFREAAGYLKGVIDLVFEHGGHYYIVDWKSNHLGWERDDYRAPALATAMVEHGYHLQLLLYALALDRYLGTRVPGYDHAAHFGGVYYVFLRGVRARWAEADGAPAGVHFDRPSRATLARIGAWLGNAPAVAPAGGPP